jgi:hypothetical protein
MPYKVAVECSAKLPTSGVIVIEVIAALFDHKAAN